MEVKLRMVMVTWLMMKAPDSSSQGIVGKILQTRGPDPAFWLGLCHLPACELGRVTDEALEVIAKGPSGSDAESKSVSSLGSSCDSPSPPPPRSNSRSSFSHARSRGLGKGGGSVFQVSVHNKEVIPLEVRWRGAGAGRAVKRGVE